MEIKKIKFNDYEIKYVDVENNGMYFCLKDVCNVLGILNSNNVSKRIDDDYKLLLDVKYVIGHNNLGEIVYSMAPTMFLSFDGLEIFLNTSRKSNATELLNYIKSSFYNDEVYKPVEDNDIIGLQNISNVRCYKDNNDSIWLNLEDVSRGLGFTRVSHSGYEVVRWYLVKEYLDYIKSMSGVYNVPKSWYAYTDTDNNERLPEYIPEDIFYMLAMKANNPVAFKFQVKVATEILPMIRRTGMYMAEQVYNKLVSDPTKLGEMMLDYGRVKKELEDNRHKMDSYDRFMDSKQSYSMASVAKTITYVNPDNNKIIGRNQLFSILRDLNILQSGKDNWNMPYQNFVDLRYFRIDVKEVNAKNETVFIRQVRILPKGIEFIINILNEHGYQVSEQDIPDKIE